MSRYVDQPRRSEREAALERALRELIDHIGEGQYVSRGHTLVARQALAMPVREGKSTG